MKSSRKSNVEAQLQTQFILMNMRSLCSNENGQFIYVEEANRVMKDIIGEKKFVTSLLSSIHSHTTQILLQGIGMDFLHKLLNNSDVYSLVKSLVDMQARMRYIEKLEKQKKKKHKRLAERYIDEYKKIKKLYAACIKNIRKQLGVKHNDSIKRMYPEAFKFSKGKNKFNDFSRGGFDDFDDPWGFSSSDFSMDDDDFDFDDNMGGGSDRFEDFKRAYYAKKNLGGKRNRGSDLDVGNYDDDEDGDFDFYDDDEDDIVDAKASKGAMNISALSNKVDALFSMIESQNRGLNSYQTPQYVAAPLTPVLVPQKAQSPSNDGVANAISNMGNQLASMMEFMQNVNTRLDSLEDGDYDDDDEEGDETFTEDELNMIAVIEAKRAALANAQPQTGQSKEEILAAAMDLQEGTGKSTLVPDSEINMTKI